MSFGLADSIDQAWLREELIEEFDLLVGDEVHQSEGYTLFCEKEVLVGVKGMIKDSHEVIIGTVLTRLQ